MATYLDDLSPTDVIGIATTQPNPIPRALFQSNLSGFDTTVNTLSQQYIPIMGYAMGDKSRGSTYTENDLENASDNIIMPKELYNSVDKACNEIGKDYGASYREQYMSHYKTDPLDYLVFCNVSCQYYSTNTKLVVSFDKNDRFRSTSLQNNTENNQYG